jgi:nucleoside-diphosphate-sugar epimerase
MKIFVAGATGAVGKSLVPLLVSRGHRVFATTRTPGKAPSLRSAGAEPVVVDGLGREGLLDAVGSAHPDVVVHEMTALSGLTRLRNLDGSFVLTNRLRTEGTQYLLEASRAAGARRFVAQSYAGWPSGRDGARIKTETDPLETHPARHTERTLQAIRALEAMVLGAADLEGVVLRYGGFYGPGTGLEPGGEFVKAIRKRRFPIVGGGSGVWSFIHIADAAEATRIAIEGGPAGLYNIVDDDPAEVSEWLPELARAVGAKPPYHLPAWVGRLLVGEAVVRMMTEQRGSSNAKARRLLGWQPAWASWRQGFHRGLSPARAA